MMSWLGSYAISVTLLFAAMTAGAKSFTVQEIDGEFRVLRGARVLVSAVVADRGVSDACSEVKSSIVQKPDGTKVWNRWCEKSDGRFRLEVAERADGAVEITMLGQVDPEDKIRTRRYRLQIPSNVFSGKEFAYLGAEREDPAAFKMKKGKFDDGFGRVVTRFLVSDGVIFDFNPLGIGDSSAMVHPDDNGNQLNRNGVCAFGVVSKNDGGYSLSAGERISASCGGFTGGKIVIREGSPDDYYKIHLLNTYKYYRFLQHSHLLAFGSPKRGMKYDEGNVEYSMASGKGWLEGRYARRRYDSVGHCEGVYYSATAGEEGATYRFSGLPDGYYILSYFGGNYSGEVDARFSLFANGQKLLQDASIGKRELRSVTRAVYVKGGNLDLEFSGKWLISAIGLQPLLGEGEDFSVKRAFWQVDGYEPCAIFRNSDYAGVASFDINDEVQILPVPGTECAGQPRLPPMPVERPDEKRPSLAWTKTAKMKLLLSNSVTLSEFDRPGSLERYLDREWAGKNVEAVMLSGMHSRHTYLGSIDRGVEAVGRMTDVLHARGIKVIDHHDATLLWNIGSGFRVLMARVGETIRALDTGLPSWHLCPSNPEFKKKYFAYLRKLAEKGVDGFQIDELEFWWNGCVCRHCRDSFRKDVGWEIPLNELDGEWNNPSSPLRRRWQNWRTHAIANWYVELRRSLNDVKDDLVLSHYTTNDAFFLPLPKRKASCDQMILRRVLNYFGTEMMTRSAMRNGRNLLPLARAKNILADPFSAPVWTWYYNVDWQNDYFAWALSVMAGQTPLLSDIQHPPQAPKYEEFAAGPYAMARYGAESVAEVALLYSTNSRDWNEEVNFRPELMGTAQILEEMHIPYEFISDEALEKGLDKRIKVLFLGESQCLSDLEIASINAFAARGGIVRLSVRAGTRNEIGEARGKPPFADGLRFVYSDASRGAEFELDENWYDLKWGLNEDQERKASFKKELAELTRCAQAWRITAPEKVFSSVWKESSGAYVIHLLNGTGVNMKFNEAVVPEAPSPAFPLIEKPIEIFAPKCIKAIAHSPDFDGGRELKLEESSDGRTRIVLPPSDLKVYTLIRIFTSSKQSEKAR
ncbi:MAG: hypothetical protein J6R18_03725 [Kiritimatiellae bacterium]|nr:hypothetical protein [Kiritimatiellia bacterium]